MREFIVHDLPLRSHPYLSDLTEAEIAVVLRQARIVSFPPGRMLPGGQGPEKEVLIVFDGQTSMDPPGFRSITAVLGLVLTRSGFAKLRQELPEVADRLAARIPLLAELASSG